MILTKEQLKKMVPNAKDFRIDQYLGPINKALQEFGITTPKQVAAFIAQVAHESGSFRYSEEIASGEAYEGRKDLGNVVPGDGKKYKGRGLIQLTGRANYKAFSEFAKIDFVSTPSLLAQPQFSAMAAGWFWWKNNLNKLADKDDFKGITKRINGGYNGLEDRLNHWKKTKSVLNI